MRSLRWWDVERAEKLGAWSSMKRTWPSAPSCDSGKIDYGPILRQQSSTSDRERKDS